MLWAIEYRRQAARYLQRLPATNRNRILGALETLAEDPDNRELDVKKLRNRPGFRLRVGGFRVLYERHQDRLVILVIAVRPRGEAYKE
jgi:mRNA interferase RelE/StbE